MTALRWTSIILIAIGCTHQPPVPLPRSPPHVAHAERDLLRYVPRGSSAVIGVNLEKARASAHWSRMGPALIRMLSEIPALITKSRAVVIALDTPRERAEWVVFVLDGLRRTDVDAAARDSHAEIATDGPFTVYRGYNTTYIWWAADDLAVVTQRANAAAILRDIQADATGLAGNAELMAAIEHTDRTATMWAAAAPVAPAIASALAWTTPPKALWGKLELVGDLHLEVGAAFANEDHMVAAVVGLTGQLEAMKAQPKAAPYLANVKLAVDGMVLRITQTIASETIEQLLAAAIASPANAGRAATP